MICSNVVHFTDHTKVAQIRQVHRLRDCVSREDAEGTPHSPSFAVQCPAEALRRAYRAIRILDLSARDPEPVNCLADYAYTREYMIVTTENYTIEQRAGHVVPVLASPPTTVVLDLEAAKIHIEMGCIAEQYKMLWLDSLACKKVEASLGS